MINFYFGESILADIVILTLRTLSWAVFVHQPDCFVNYFSEGLQLFEFAGLRKSLPVLAAVRHPAQKVNYRLELYWQRCSGIYHFHRFLDKVAVQVKNFFATIIFA